MTELPRNSFDVLASERINEQLAGMRWQTVPNMLALDGLARHVGLPLFRMPLDTRVIISQQSFGENPEEDPIRYPAHLPPGQPHDVQVSVPTLTERNLTQGIADALLNHPTLSTAVTRYEDTRRGKRWSCGSLIVYGSGLLTAGNYAPEPTRPIAMFAGASLVVVGALGLIIQPFQDKPPACPPVDGLAAPIALHPIE